MGTRDAGPGQGYDRETVVFRLGEASYGIDISRVKKVVRMREITPCAREGTVLCGIVNIKGRTIPVYDIAQLLESHRAKTTPKSRIIVTEGEGGAAAFVVDAVTSVVTEEKEGSNANQGLALVDLDAVLAHNNLI